MRVEVGQRCQQLGRQRSVEHQIASRTSSSNARFTRCAMPLPDAFGVRCSRLRSAGADLHSLAT